MSSKGTIFDKKVRLLYADDIDNIGFKKSSVFSRLNKEVNDMHLVVGHQTNRRRIRESASMSLFIIMTSRL